MRIPGVGIFGILRRTRHTHCECHGHLGMAAVEGVVSVKIERESEACSSRADINAAKSARAAAHDNR